MSKMIPVYLSVTTASDGTGSATSESVYNGELKMVQWIDGTFDDGVDGTFSVTNTDAGVDYTALTLTNANNDAIYLPRYPTVDEAGAGITYDGTREVHACILIVGKIKLTIAQGGNAKTGGAVVFVEC